LAELRSQLKETSTPKSPVRPTEAQQWLEKEVQQSRKEVERLVDSYRPRYRRTKG
jgi:hypothetical protein